MPRWRWREPRLLHELILPLSTKVLGFLIKHHRKHFINHSGFENSGKE